MSAVAYGCRDHETDRLEVGDRAACAYDETFAIQHRLAWAVGQDAGTTLHLQVAWFHDAATEHASKDAR